MNRAILIIAEKENLRFYRNLRIEGIEIDFGTLVDCSYLPAHDLFNLVLLDCGFSHDKGIQYLKEIKTICPRAPIIFITDMSTEGLAIRAFRAGARDYFKRPFHDNELLDAVERIFIITNGAREQRTPYCFERSDENSQIFGKATTDMPLNILRVVRYVENNLFHNISLSDLAREANFSKFHFSRQFKMHIGMSPKQFVTKMRIERAKSLLMNTDNSISSIATTVGFNDPGNFVRHFKKITGLTPSSFAGLRASQQTLNIPAR